MSVMKFGYARVSTDDQELARQIDALNNYGVDKIYKEKITGIKASRPELDKLKNAVREGDSVIIESLSRLGRSTKDLLALLEEWDNQGVKLVSLKENIDTTTPTGKLLVTVLSAISQFERDITVQRTNEGLQAARQRGRKGGRPKANAENVRKAVEYYNRQTMSVKEITAICGISQATLYRALNEQRRRKSE